jgi:hypothetical protein
LDRIKKWNDGILERGNTGRMEYWNDGIMGQKQPMPDF